VQGWRIGNHFVIKGLIKVHPKGDSRGNEILCGDLSTDIEEYEYLLSMKICNDVSY